MLSKDEKNTPCANLDKLHRMLCPGNERALIPGLNRLGVLKYNGHESTCYPWTIHTVLKDIASGSHEGYSLEESFSAWSKRRHMPKDRVNKLKLAAAMLTIWPELDITARAAEKMPENTLFVNETLLALKREDDDYAKIKNRLQTNHHASAYIACIVAEADKIKIDPNSIVSLRQLTILFDAMNDAMVKPSSDSASRCLKSAQEITQCSRAKMLGGFALGFIGIVVILASLLFAVGSSGLFCPVSIAGVYSGFYLMNSAVAIIGTCAGLSCLKFGVSFFNQGRSAQDLMTQVEQFSKTITPIEVSDHVSSASSSTEHSEPHFDSWGCDDDDLFVYLSDWRHDQ